MDAPVEQGDGIVNAAVESASDSSHSSDEESARAKGSVGASFMVSDRPPLQTHSPNISHLVLIVKSKL